ncbi:MAG: MinD/ParA family protein [Deltaproteobacteria bacterium]|nr:MAG: MinD/ParA family protein [Deltaproteobacteria bacterium]
MNKKATIIPIASGKGGVGKTVFAANLSIALAKLGYPTVAVDLDLGGSNLYSCLGIPNNYPGIGDYLKVRNVKLSDLIIQTGIPNLKFLPGDGKMPFTANISYNHRIALLKEIKKISSGYIVLDLGAGTVFNTLNFFAMSPRGIIVTTFETPSIMNFVMFLRNFIFRAISSVVSHDKKVLSMVAATFRRPTKSGPVTVSHLIDKIAEKDHRLASKAKELCDYYRPRIVFNMGDHPDELKILKKLSNTLKHGLSLEVDHFGYIPYDDTVRLVAKKREVLLTSHPESIVSESIGRIADRIVNCE